MELSAWYLWSWTGICQPDIWYLWSLIFVSAWSLWSWTDITAWRFPPPSWQLLAGTWTRAVQIEALKRTEMVVWWLRIKYQTRNMSVRGIFRQSQNWVVNAISTTLPRYRTFKYLIMIHLLIIAQPCQNIELSSTSLWFTFNSRTLPKYNTFKYLITVHTPSGHNSLSVSLSWDRFIHLIYIMGGKMDEAYMREPGCNGAMMRPGSLVW